MPGLDRRFGWSEPPLAAVVAAQALALASCLGMLKVFLVNRWAGRTVETWPGQEVITTGLYAIVRHPKYVAILVLYVASPVALGSWWAVIPAIVYAPMLVMRILNEEEVLVRELPGYEEYRKNPASLWVPLGGLAEPVSACQTSSMTKHGTPREIKENEYVGGEEEE